MHMFRHYKFHEVILNQNIIRILKLPLISYSQSRLSETLNNLLLNMPKVPNHTAVLKQQRQKLKEKGKKYVPGTVSIKVLGSGAKGTSRSLYVFTDQSRYLFNCGEGTQRLAHEHKAKLSKLEHIFITHLSWDNIGGLPGVALTIQDVGVPEIILHGPPGTDEIFSATRRFVVLKDLTVQLADLQNQEFEDNVMTVKYVPLFEAQLDDENKTDITNTFNSRNVSSVLDGNSSDETDDIDYYAHEKKRARSSSRSKDRKRLCKSPESPKATTISSVCSMAVSYICRLKPRPGSLNLEKCVEKGVPPGPLLGRLKSGEDVELEDGSVVKSAEVCFPDDPGPVFLVVECPSDSFLDSFINNPMFREHQAVAEKDEDLAYLVVHFTPPEVMNDVRYRKWMDAFSQSTFHLAINEGSTCTGSIAVHRIQNKLHQLHPFIFPLLNDSGILHEEVEPDTTAASPTALTTQQNVIQARTLCSVNLRPNRMLDSESTVKINVKSFIEEINGIEGFSEALAELQDQLKSYDKDVAPYPKIVFLGTGSCIPNKTRNTSGIVLEVSDSKVLMLDCGEGTLGQLWRFYGVDGAEEILRKLQCVYVSHLHADHHLGLVGLIHARRRAYWAAGTRSFPPLIVLAPKQIMAWLSFYHRRFQPLLHEIQLVPNSALEMEKFGLDAESSKKLMEALEMNDISTVPVKHCPNAFGVALTHSSGWKITYSGDTMPCPQLIKLGQNSDLLIHEATMEDELVSEARLKMHSTTSEAIETGQKMGAKFTILTHFSQRYAKLPRFNNNFTSNVGIAFDNMQVRLGDLPVLPLFYPVLKLMFAEDYEELEQRAVRRQLRAERAAQQKQSES
ncbi:ribonuclease Z, mitochondrial [Schistocerca cancellata]|uniref:ribonuclease Z, mitochondrial n=1 Tax=Schistocerca cancellata TaxID=274614 RepID=UPI00211877B6|nr:ribonuclease Z, mitochondrial [Schistocerca cancellata]